MYAVCKRAREYADFFSHFYGLLPLYGLRSFPALGRQRPIHFHFASAIPHPEQSPASFVQRCTALKFAFIVGSRNQLCEVLGP